MPESKTRLASRLSYIRAARSRMLALNLTRCANLADTRGAARFLTKINPAGGVHLSLIRRRSPAPPQDRRPELAARGTR